MPDYSELEIALSHRDAESYLVELRFTQPGSEVDNPPELGVASFNFLTLRTLIFQPQRYGKELARMLFSDDRLLAKFELFCGLALNNEERLRLRLFIDRSAPELHTLRWEMLRDPREGHQDSWLIADERIVFSRYLRSSDWRPVKLKSRGQLRALVAIANPSDTAAYGLGDPLKPGEVAGELSRARSSLGEIVASELASDLLHRGQVGLNQIIDHLHEGFDILYLLCHGAFRPDELGNKVPHLWLEQPDGTAKVESGIELVERLRRLSIQPRLIVLASCQSAGTGETADRAEEQDSSDADSLDAGDLKGPLAALGPRLAEAGIAAVVAMQGNVSPKTIAEFMPVFFKKLCEDGQLDQAMATARSFVGKNGDAWMPVLYSRLRSGRFWYERGFRASDQKAEFEKWASLLGRIKEGKCTPILGYGLLETVLGSKREIAQSWADTYKFPMEPSGREDLPQVAQYLISAQDELFPHEELGRYLMKRLSERYGLQIDPERAPIEQLDKLLVQVIQARRAQEPAEPHWVLANLPFKVYITTNPDNVLVSSLSDAGKTPHVELCPWNVYLRDAPPEYDDTPTKDTPLVFHLFGQLQEPDTLVLTEDDYFDYLIGVTSNRDLIPEVVLGKQTRTQLLFLGFQLDDWNFRVLFKSLLRPGAMAARGYEHVAVQIDPDEDRLLDAKRAKQNLEKYFGKNKIAIYWGSAEDFLQELRSKWNERYGKEIPL